MVGILNKGLWNWKVVGNMPKLTEKVNFTVYGIARPKGSMRAFVAGNRAVVTNNNPSTKHWQNLVATMAQQNRPSKIFEDAVSVKLEFQFIRPKSIKESQRPFPIVAPDIDKLQRCILDGLTGIIYKDDCQVTNVVASKSYGDEPMVIVEVREVHR